MSADSPRILPIGDFYPQDGQGYVLNRCAWDKVGNEWRPLVGAVVESMKRAWGDRLLGVFLRGSVPAGTAVAGISDLDAFALLEQRPGTPFLRWESPAWAEETAIRLQKSWPVASSVELMAADHDPEFPGQNPRIKMILKTQSLCVWGRDLSLEIPPYRPGPDMRIHSRWLSGDLERFRGGGVQSAAAIRSLMKTLVRTGFELVMEREGRYATDLYPCMMAFLGHYPEFEEAMEAAIRIFLEPASIGKRLPEQLERLAYWMEGEVAVQFGS